MRQRITQLGKRPFVRNVITVTSGAAVSQAIGMAFSPVITRLYGPEAYGTQGVFMSIAGVMGSISALTYPVAIILPKRDSSAANLAWLSVYIGILMSALTSLLLFFWGHDFFTFLNVQGISSFMYLIPIFMVISVVSSVIGEWLIRKGAFSLTARVTVWHALLIGSIKTGLGFLNPTASMLVITNVLSGFLSSGLMLLGLRNKRLGNKSECAVVESQTGKWELAKLHRDFPLFRAPQVLLNAVSQSLPVVMLATQFGPVSAGYFSLASMVLAMPAALIVSSFMQVFYPRINEALRSGEDARGLIIKATIVLAVCGAVPFSAVIIIGPTLFSFVFGSEWQTAGIYARWLSVWLFFQFINKPAVSAIPALGLQRGLLVYECFSSGTKLLALYLGARVFGNDVVAIALFSVFGVVAYIWLIIWVILQSKLLDSKVPRSS